MKDILQEIVARKREEVSLLKRNCQIDLLQTSPMLSRPTISMKKALVQSDSGIIAEFKRKSPSKGWLNQYAEPASVIPAYEYAGATAISILTDAFFFGGQLQDLQRARRLTKLPILRKDFILDEIQLLESRAAGADAILLIAACLRPDGCLSLARQAHAWGLEVLLEIHEESELDYLTDEIDMVGVNNRHLGSFHTDVSNSFLLAEKLPSQIIKISESGIGLPATVQQLRNKGFDGFLMGEHFMKTNQPGEILKHFINQLHES